MKKENAFYFVADWKHWLGWLISAVAVLVALYFATEKYIISSVFLLGLIVFLVIVIIDIIKHVTKLQ